MCVDCFVTPGPGESKKKLVFASHPPSPSRAEVVFHNFACGVFAIVPAALYRIT